MSNKLKMDLVIMPCMVVMYILDYLDRQKIASAKLAGIDADLDLTSGNYQTCVSILFVEYSKFCTASLVLWRTLILGSSHASFDKHDREQGQISCILYMFCYGNLGSDLSPHVGRIEFHKCAHGSLLSWIRRGSLFPLSLIFSIFVL
jgi:hypothetical protein